MIIETVAVFFDIIFQHRLLLISCLLWCTNIVAEVAFYQDKGNQFQILIKLDVNYPTGLFKFEFNAVWWTLYTIV